jgi:hypothetical protein
VTTGPTPSRAAVRSLLFDFFAGRGGRHAAKIRSALLLIEQRAPHLHRALIDAHVHGHGDVDWREEEEAVDFLAALLGSR